MLPLTLKQCSRIHALLAVSFQHFSHQAKPILLIYFIRQSYRTRSLSR